MNSAAVDVPSEAGIVARWVPLDRGLYAFGLAAGTPWRDPIVGLALPAVQICVPPGRDDAIEISGMSGGSGAWLGGRRRTLFVRSARDDGAVLVTGYLARDPDAPRLDVEIHRLDSRSEKDRAAGAAASGPYMTLTLSSPASPIAGRPVKFDIITHIRGRGDLRFIDTVWAGRLGHGLWVEAFALATRDAAAAAAIEYKGLTASGDETPWLPCGTLCGTRGRTVPLVGFAIRQKAGTAGARFDCGYSGYFQSGATVGPSRNGAPCRSPHDNDPLEGLQISIAPRPAAAATSAPSAPR